MKKKIFILIFVVLLVVVCSSFAALTLYSHDDTDKQVGSINVKNPATGEVWDSIEEYIYRNKSKVNK